MRPMVASIVGARAIIIVCVFPYRIVANIYCQCVASEVVGRSTELIGKKKSWEIKMDFIQ